MRTYFTLTAMALRAELQYRGNLLIAVLGGLCFQGVGLLFIWAVLQRFPDLNGWSVEQIAFLYGIRLTAHGLWVVPFGQLKNVDDVIRSGEYDRYLARPVHPLLQLMSRRFPLTALGDLSGGVVVLAAASTRLSVRWSTAGTLFLLLAVIGGALIELSYQLATAAMSFRLLSTMAVRIGVDTVFNDVGGYPLTIFSGAGQMLFTFLIPVGLVAYFPASVILGRTSDLVVPKWLAFGTPLIGVVLFAGALAVWNRQSQHYQSSGH